MSKKGEKVSDKADKKEPGKAIKNANKESKGKGGKKK